MSKVSVTLNGREFTIGCEDGQEAYLRELAVMLDKRVSSIAAQVGQIGDLRLLLMAALMLVDDQKDSERRIEALEAHVERLRAETTGSATLRLEERTRIAEQLTRVAERLEAFAEELDAPAADVDGTEQASEIAEAHA